LLPPSPDCPVRGGAVALRPDFASLTWDAEGCAPLIVTGAKLDAARRWVNSLAPAAARSDAQASCAA
jgi:hypothetical protein